MYKLTDAQIEIIIDALNMAIASNKRMQNAKPKFKNIFEQIEADLNTIKSLFLTKPSK